MPKLFALTGLSDLPPFPPLPALLHQGAGAAAAASALPSAWQRAVLTRVGPGLVPTKAVGSHTHSYLCKPLEL